MVPLRLVKPAGASFGTSAHASLLGNVTHLEEKAIYPFSPTCACRHPCLASDSLINGGEYNAFLYKIATFFKKKQCLVIQKHYKLPHNTND